jgi:eukaryotic-like serine/threonine-protein kinase
MTSPGYPLQRDEFSGRMLGKYEVICRLSAGGMAEIFLALQRGPGGFQKLAVLKQILPEAQEEDEFVRMFIAEAQIAASFSHPNLAQVYELDIADGELFMAMEFIAGATLSEVVKASSAEKQPVPLGFVLRVVRDTAQALHYAHHFKDPLGRARNVVHRDVAPRNILVSYEGTTKLLDFGIAKGFHRTGAGKIKGTLGYMSPEQLRVGPLDGRSDICSLGVVLHECMTGKSLYGDKIKTVAEFIDTVLTTVPAPPSRHNPRVPPGLDEVVLKAIAKRPEDRFQTARDFGRALESAAPGEIWSAEQCGELIGRLFRDRQEKTRPMIQSLSGVGSPGGVPSSGPFTLPLGLPVATEAPIVSPTVLGSGPTTAPIIKPSSRSRVVRAAAAFVGALLVGSAVWWWLQPSPPASPAPTPLVEAKGEPAPEATIGALDLRATPGVVTRAPPAASFGWISLDSHPWARMSLDGREIGVTPISHFRTKAGQHSVEAIRADGSRQTLHVQVTAQREEKVVLKWR